MVQYVMRISLAYIFVTTSMVSVTKSASLPTSNIRVLNREIRRFLLQEVSSELTKKIVPNNQQLNGAFQCKNSLQRHYGGCALCASKVCQTRHTQCKLPTEKTDFCEFIGYGEEILCSMALDPERALLNQLSEILEKLSGFLKYAIYDMDSSVLDFITELEKILGTGWNSGYHLVLKNTVMGLKEGYTSEKMRMDAHINYRSPTEKIVRQMSHSLISGMTALGASIPNSVGLGDQLAKTLAELLGTHFGRGRRKRAVSCKILALNPGSCLPFKASCNECRNVTSHEPITDACGPNSVNQFNAPSHMNSFGSRAPGPNFVNAAKPLVDALSQTQQIFDEVLSRADFVKSGMYEWSQPTTPGNLIFNVKFSVHIQQKPTTIISRFEVFNIRGSAKYLADQIWKEWKKTVTVV